MRELADNLTPVERKALVDIAESGLHVVHVPGEDAEPCYSFTIGLWHNFQQPEVIVFGLQEEVAHELLNAIADEAAEGRSYLGGQRHEGLLVGYAVCFIDVPEGDYPLFLGLAQWAYMGEQFPCVQLVWPDKQGRWPWDRGVRAGFADAQPVLGSRGAGA